MNQVPSDERLKAISEAQCLCSHCEPDLAPGEVRPMAVELLALRRDVAALRQIADEAHTNSERAPDVRAEPMRLVLERDWQLMDGLIRRSSPTKP